MQGTIYNRNLFHRLGDALAAWKATPTPAQLYPPRYMGGDNGPHWISWQGWAEFEKQAGAQDEQRVKKAVQSTSVFANMRAIATEFASSELIVKERKGDKLEDIENHPLELLWEAPNPDMGRSFLMSFWAWSYTMAGKAFLYWLPAQGSIKEIWPVPPFMIRPVPASKEFIGGYAFRAKPDAEPILIPREYITYSHSPNIFDIRDGLSFLVAAMTPIESEIAMGFWNRNFFEEGNGIPDGLIALSKDTLDADLARVRQEMKDFFGGTKRGMAVARENDLKYVPWGRSQKDAEFIEGIKLSSTQIGRTMGFPDGYWSESANRANAEQARATMIAGAVWPLLVALHEDMNAGVIKRWWGEQYRAEFKDIRPEDRQLKIQEQTLRVQYWTVNELREVDGKDPLEDPRGEMFVSEIAKGTPLPATPAGEMTEAYIAEQEEAVAEEEAALPVEEGVEEDALIEGGEPPMPMEEEALPMPTKAADLERWERKALKSLKRFHTADVRFESNAIPLSEQVRIHEALKGAKYTEEVRRVFMEASQRDAVGAVPSLECPASPADTARLVGVKAHGEDAALDTLLDSEWAGALEWARKANE